MKLFFKIIGVLFLICIGFIAAMFYFTDPNKYKSIIVSEFKNQTDQELQLNGNIEVTFFPSINIQLNNPVFLLTIKDQKVEINANKVILNVDWFALFQEVKKIKSFEGVDLNIVMFDNARKSQTFKIDKVSSTVISTYQDIIFPNLILQIENESFKGNLTAAFRADNIKLTGKFHCDEWKPALWNNGFAPVFHPGVSGHFQFNIDKVKLDTIDISNADISIDLEPKSVSILHKGTIESGVLTGKFIFTAKDANLQFELKNADAANVLKLFHSKAELKGGKIYVNFDGKTSGNSIKEAMNNLAGKALIHIEQMTVENQQFDSRYVDLFAAMWKQLIPTPKDTVLECGVVVFDANKGKWEAKNKIAFETKDLYVIGGGVLETKSEKLDFTFQLIPRSNLNIEIGSYTNTVYLKGTLTNPKWKASSRGLIHEGGTLLLGLATGGTSLIAEKLYKIITQKGSPCNQILKEN